MDRRGPLLAMLLVSGCGRIDYRPSDASAAFDGLVGLDASAPSDAGASPDASSAVDARAGADASADTAVAPDGAGCARAPFEEPVLLAEVSSRSSEYAPTLSADLLTLYFQSDRPGGTGGHDLYVAVRPTLDEPFQTPVEMSAISSAAEDGAPSLSSDGLTLYFESNRSGPSRIYTATRTTVGDPFGSVTPVEGALLALIDQTGPDVSRDDLTLYFGSHDPSGAGESDVWVSTRADRTAPWGAPTLLAGVNTAGLEGGPSVDASQLTLYLASDRREIATDIYVATRTEPTAAFSIPTLLPIASSVGIGEHDVDISDDGSTMVFTLHRDEGLGSTDVWISTRVCAP